ncbi:MAG: DUF1929 domain-containing protein [Candidatus Rokubacteria bacterium]|nr:DUF1929 domain-containing protein [Candidatus Rokubacteria bacterium]
MTPFALLLALLATGGLVLGDAAFPPAAGANHTHLEITAPCVGGPSVCGEWSAPFYPSPVVADATCIDNHGQNAFREIATGLCVSHPDAVSQAAVNAALLKNGKVFFYSGVDAANTDWPQEDPNLAKSRVWDPVTGAMAIPTPEGGGGGDMFCSANSIMADGRLLVVGGTEWVAPPASDTPPTQPQVLVKGLSQARIYDPATNSWSQAKSMATNRWYPSLYLLGDGRMLAVSGTGDLGDVTTMRTTLEAYTPAGPSPQKSDPFLQPDSWDLETNRLLPLYARMHVLPGGKIYYSGVGALWAPFGEESAVAENFGQYYDPVTRQWRNVGPMLGGSRQHGWSILLPLRPQDDYRTEVVITNGTLNRDLVASNTGEVADFGVAPGGVLVGDFDCCGPVSNPVPRQLIATSNIGRWFSHFTHLPDGTFALTAGGTSDDVLLIGGAQYILTTEVFDPNGTTGGLRGQWGVMASQQVPRAYHSTALLLPDARVLSMGHVPIAVGLFNQVGPAAVELGVVEKRMEIFSPPYLFRGPRPTLKNVPKSAAYDSTFKVQTPQASVVESAVLIRPGSVTHATDFDQRLVELEIVARTGDTLTLKAPPNSTVAPPGAYMLFINKGTVDGAVPSVAQFINIGS